MQWQPQPTLAELMQRLTTLRQSSDLTTRHGKEVRELMLHDPEVKARLARFDDPAFLRRPMEVVEGFDEGPEPQAAAQKPTRTRTRTHKPSLISVAKQVAKAGIEVARFDVLPDGTIGVVLGKPESPLTINSVTTNEWDTVQ